MQDSTRWLLDGPAWIEYRTRVDLLEQSETEPEVMAARQAMLTDPLCNNIADADNCIAELLEAERDALPAYWYK